LPQLLQQQADQLQQLKQRKKKLQQANLKSKQWKASLHYSVNSTKFSFLPLSSTTYHVV
jgi:hypothetical protein